MKSIYLAGAGVRGWAGDYRKRASIYLKDWKTLDPFAGRTIDERCSHYTPHEIVTRDLCLIKQSDIMLAEMFLPDYSYVGTSMEIFYASHILGLPVVVWTKAKKHHYWLRDLTVKMFDSLEESCDYINSFWSD